MANPSAPNSHLNETTLVARLATGDESALSMVVKTHYTSLYRYALKFVRYKEPAEEITQDIFVSLWQKRQSLLITTSLHSYLYASVKYCSIDYLRRRYNKNIFVDLIHASYSDDSSADEKMTTEELRHIVQNGIMALPEKCRIIFDLSRHAGLTYSEIADQLNISPKTVETQISIALSKLKDYVSKHWDKVVVIPLILTLA